uniref:hypothetical protein n=1 Tax=uncultured Tenacibaculum sp. TaxID=174713 RepID=UPI0026377769|nr:hypothetical protein [uncultured Tenacibaculum sp.]
MKNLLFILAVSCTILPTFSQRDQELFCINDTHVLVPEFKQVYEKNLPLVEDGKGESKIEEIYQLLESGASFEK